jgi:hypothetical protein
MFGESITSIVFRLINFAALAGFFVYIFKKYMQHGIEESIEQDKQHEIDVNNRIIEINHRSSELSEEIINQEKLCQYLLERADQWKVAFDRDMQEKQHEQQVQHLKAVERAERQADTLAYEHMIQGILPHAIEEAQAQLIASFAEEGKNKVFVHDIIHYLTSSPS